jgi:hypothetical protein
MVARARQLNVRRRPAGKVRWLGPLPIWAKPGPAGLRLSDDHRVAQPAILRFDHDDFMQEYLDTLTSEPQRLGDWLAKPETWRAPMATPKLSQIESQPASTVAFLYDQTRRLTSAKKPLLPTAINLQQFLKTTPKQTLPSASVISDEQLPLKLYQASQKRHYLVTASLICDEPGLPDCEPELSRREKASFVLRRVMPPEENAGAPLSQWDEYAFIPSTRGNAWRRIGRYESSPTRTLIAGEEQLPMFPVTFDSHCGYNRRLLNGTIPVSRREQWVGAALGGDVGAVETTSLDVGKSLPAMLFQTDVVAPWKLLLEQAEFKKSAADKNSSAAAQEDRKRLLRTAHDELQTGSWYVLLDFARFLQARLPNIWQVLTKPAMAETLAEDEQALLNVLRNSRLSWQLVFRLLTGKKETDSLTLAEQQLWAVLPYIASGDGANFPGQEWQWWTALMVPTPNPRYNCGHMKWSLAHALVAIAGAEEGLESVDTTFNRFDENGTLLTVDERWPDFLFPLADPDLDAPLPAVNAAELAGLSGLEKKQRAVDVLAKMIEALLPAGEPVEELIDSVPVGDPRDVWFVIRCVYERPHCGPLFQARVSAPTQRFLMAPFFDPDAPARPVRIPMPLDISPAGLRKYQKNTGFVISDMLCGKIKRIRQLTFGDLVLSVLPWPFHKDLPNVSDTGPCGAPDNFGMICSLSIPIVTLVALILMMIMVALFDLFFRWIPYLFICLPIPGLKGKGSR